MKDKLGVSGRFAAFFIDSKLTPVLIILALAIGLFATSITSREEEPQITVPMVDVFVDYPGATPAEVEDRVTKPVERLLSEISGVEYIYSQAMPGRNLTIVRFNVGENPEASLTKLYSKLMANYDTIPPGVSQPLIKMRSIDDVPVLALTFWDKSGQTSSYELRRMAQEATNLIKQDKDASEIKVIGGQPREIAINVNPAKLAAYNLSMDRVLAAVGANNSRSGSGLLPVAGKSFTVTTGNFISNLSDAKQVVVSANNKQVVLLADIAELKDGSGEPASYVLMNNGPADRGTPTSNGIASAVTISVAKKAGVNATRLTERLLNRIEQSRKDFIPSTIEITPTRNYGETANDKSNELLEHMMLATLAVVLLIAFTLGRREAIVVAITIPVTLALTLMVNWLYGYTLNRVTLFALIFSIGILVDDAIVVVENIHRHFVLRGFSRESAISAVDEVGNPTILATFTVIASLLPMAFVSGLMGPYMRPIPIGASAAMLFSLAVAFAISPWLAMRLLRKDHYTNAIANHESTPSPLQLWYEKIITTLLRHKKKRRLALGVVVVLLLLAGATIPLKLVAVKMLPFDNKSEFQVIIDMDEGTSLENSTAAAVALGQYISTVPEVKNYQIYSGTASPYNFNGLVRHYFLRGQPWQADIQVNLADKSARSRSSHEIAKNMRPELIKIAERYHARIKVAEVPPGPPVLSTLVAEIYGPDLNQQRAIAAKIKDIFKATPDVVDVDWYVEANQPKFSLVVDQTKAATNGISVDNIARSAQQMVSGASAGLAHFQREDEPVSLTLRIPYSTRAQLNNLLKQLSVQNPSTGNTIPLSELVTVQSGFEDKTIYHKNLRRVTYVIGDMAGAAESPAYGIINMLKPVNDILVDGNRNLKQYSSVQPDDPREYAMKWDGEWHVTYEVFRDMGIAFAVVLVLIYILVLAWFKDFLLPLVIMTPIPLTLIGIMPGHWIFGAFFTATSMIGFIALSGIIVRNSILLVDFANSEHRAGMLYIDALAKAGIVRMRPIILTAAAVVVGSIVMLFDPIFQGLAIAMMFGAIVATILTLLVIPLLCWELALWRGIK